MHAFGVRSSSSQHFTSTNPGFFFMPPSFREGVMGQAEPAPLLQPLCGCWCALNQLSYKCQPSPYSRTRPPRGGMGECRAVPGPPMRSASAYLPPTCFAGSWFASAPTHLAKPRTFASLFPPLAALGFGSHSAKKRRWLFAILFQKTKLQPFSSCSTPAFFPIPAVPWNPE